MIWDGTAPFHCGGNEQIAVKGVKAEFNAGTAITVGACTALIASERLHPILAFLLGVLAGAVAGGIAWTLVRIWPVLRLIWWWSLEITTVVAVTAGWIQLVEHTVLWVRFVVVGVLVGIPAGVPAILAGGTRLIQLCHPLARVFHAIGHLIERFGLNLSHPFARQA